MKKLLVSITLFALIAILFSSCSNSSKLAFNKRHYRSGNFIDRVGKTNTVPAYAGKPAKTKQPIPALAVTKSENQIITNTPVITSQKEQINGSKVNSASPVKNISITSIGATNNVTEGPVLDNKQALSEYNEGGDRSAAGSALSLLWVVIIIILIIWLVAIVIGGFGLGGGLINLLLLIALILLILWLLRIL